MNMIAAVLEADFFPRWHSVLFQWLSQQPDVAEVTPRVPANFVWLALTLGGVGRPARGTVPGSYYSPLMCTRFPPSSTHSSAL